MVDELTLNCYIRSKEPYVSFQVKISKTETVFGLHEAIKVETQNEFKLVAAHTLALYKPKTAVSRPFKEHLSKLTLSEHAEFLLGVNVLSQVFPEPPPEGDIHVIVDMPMFVCWLRGVTLDFRFQVKVPMTGTVLDLQEAIKNKKSALRDVDAATLRLFRISGDDDELQKSLDKMGDGKPLQGLALAPNFLSVPVLDPLLVVVEVSAGGSPTLVQQPISGGDPLQDYEDIFLRVKNWGKFEQSDIRRNEIEKARNMDTPNFITAFERKLDRKPRLPENLPASFDAARSYFEHSEDPIAEDGSQEEVRSADILEVMHTTYHVASPEWQRRWQRNGPCRDPLNEDLTHSMFFDVLLMRKSRAAVALTDENWPITVVVNHDNGNEQRHHCPKSVFSISISTLPRLLVEVEYTLQDSRSTDLIRMLTTGAFVVRFANKFVSTFREQNFVLCAVFICDDGTVIRYTLFQNQNDDTVYYNELQLSLNDPHGRAEFARYLYNLLSVELDQDQDLAAKSAICELHSRINDCNLKSFYAKNPTGRDHAQLRAHGYEVEPEVIVDDRGDEWRPILERPDHILTVYRPSNSNEKFIAKNVLEDSCELEILRLLDTILLKSDHVIPLIDSFDGWAILPKMATVQYYVDFSPKVFDSRVSRACWGLIKGLAYLHKHRIAHRDIKPDNLVVDKNFNLKIIDFDSAMQVEHEDEEVDDQCGTRYWIAPEVEKKLRHSPIKADRWACGRVILFLLDRFSKKDESLRAFARDLVAKNPKQRPSLLEWGRYSAPPLSDAGNVENSDAREVVRPRRDRMEVDDDDTRPPNVKKQRLDESG